MNGLPRRDEIALCTCLPAYKLEELASVEQQSYRDISCIGNKMFCYQTEVLVLKPTKRIIVTRNIKRNTNNVADL